MASFALETVHRLTAGFCQGYAMPRPAGAPLTEPARPPKRFLIRGRRKQIEVSYNPGTVIGSGSREGGRPYRDRFVALANSWATGRGRIGNMRKCAAIVNILR